MDDVICVGVDVLILLDLLGVVDDHIGLEVELGGVEREILSLLHGVLEVAFDLILQEAVDGMVVKILPLDAFVGVYCQHSFQNVLGDIRDGVYLPREAEGLILDVVDKFDHVGGLVGRAAWGGEYLPKSVS
jgi:hypothetical protein